MNLKKYLFPGFAILLICIGIISAIDYWVKDTEIDEEEQREIKLFEDLRKYTEQLKENNNKIDGIEKVLISAIDEEEALKKENKEIGKQIDLIVYELKGIERGTSEWHPGKLTEDGDHQEMPETKGETEHQRFKDIANAYGLNPSMIWEVENHYGIKEGLILCIAIAETSGGKSGAGIKNIGNVGNTDGNPRGQSYSNIGASLDAIGRTLTNQYIGQKKTLGCLSNAGSCKEYGDNGKRYATSDGNWEKNMVTCLSTIYGTIDPETFNIRR